MTKTLPLMIRRFLAEPFEGFVFLLALIASLKQVRWSKTLWTIDVGQTLLWSCIPVMGPGAIKAPDWLLRRGSDPWSMNCAFRRGLRTWQTTGWKNTWRMSQWQLLNCTMKFLSLNHQDSLKPIFGRKCKAPRNSGIQLYCQVIGNVDSGKSTLVGVLTKGGLDDGRGLARAKVPCTMYRNETKTESIGKHPESHSIWFNFNLNEIWFNLVLSGLQFLSWSGQRTYQQHSSGCGLWIVFLCPMPHTDTDTDTDDWWLKIDDWCCKCQTCWPTSIIEDNTCLVPGNYGLLCCRRSGGSLDITSWFVIFRGDVIGKSWCGACQVLIDRMANTTANSRNTTWQQVVSQSERLVTFSSQVALAFSWHSSRTIAYITTHPILRSL